MHCQTSSLFEKSVGKTLNGHISVQECRILILFSDYERSEYELYSGVVRYKKKVKRDTLKGNSGLPSLQRII